MEKIILVLIFLLFLFGFIVFFFKFFKYLKNFKQNANIPKTTGSSDAQLLVKQKEAHKLFSQLVIEQGMSATSMEEFVTYNFNTIAIKSQIKWHKEKPWFIPKRKGASALGSGLGRSYIPNAFSHFTFTSGTKRNCTWTTDLRYFEYYSRNFLGYKNSKKIRIPNPSFHKRLLIQLNEYDTKFDAPQVLAQIFELSRVFNASRIFIHQKATEVTLSVDTNITADLAQDVLFKTMGKVMNKKIYSASERLQTVHNCINILSQ